MLMYQFNNEIMSHIKQNQVIISSYSVNPKTNALTVILEDKLATTSAKFIKLLFKDFIVTNETFEIEGLPITQVYVERHVHYFKSNYFVGLGLVIKNPKDPKQAVAIRTKDGD